MNSLIISLGSNIGDKLNNLNKAKVKLQKFLKLISESRVFTSVAVDYTDQPDFYNQVLEFEIPDIDPLLVMNKLLDIEQELGRVRTIDKGPRIIDIDIIFWGTLEINSQTLTIPHYAWSNRSFIVRPMHDLSCFQRLEKCFKIPTEFEIESKPID